MKRAFRMISHVVMILSLMFLVFVILDQFNPMMNFVNNPISIVLLACLCIAGIIQSILSWMQHEGGNQ
ncbi:MAG: hypothetical protein K6A68_01525 [Clostridiales bacterium]|jgi:protein-S-isoprenylcysteine O-methyltransferase Ste14|nr:hypothetical protein [Clostridia bacterium]MCR4882216.1 hypothetical protein [Clostridiales bacterium]